MLKTYRVFSTKVAIDEERGIAILDGRLFDPACLGKILPTGEIVWSVTQPKPEVYAAAMSQTPENPSSYMSAIDTGHIENSRYRSLSHEICERRPGSLWWNHLSERFGSFISSDPIPVCYQLVINPGG